MICITDFYTFGDGRRVICGIYYKRFKVFKNKPAAYYPQYYIETLLDL